MISILGRMAAILLDVAQIVQQVDRARQQREQAERRRRALQERPHRRGERTPAIVEREDETGEHQQVFHPLLGPQTLEQGEESLLELHASAKVPRR